MLRATFDENNHAVSRGWATRWTRPFLHVSGYRQIHCRLFGHQYPNNEPTPANGHSPSNLTRCPRCATLLGFHVEGQHRYGSLSREIFEATRREAP